MDEYMAAAPEEAGLSMTEDGYPVGSVVVRGGKIAECGRNRFLQTGDPTAREEMEAVRDATKNANGHADARVKGASVYTTMMPCEMFAGAIIRFEIVVVGEMQTYGHASTDTLMLRRASRHTLQSAGGPRVRRRDGKILQSFAAVGECDACAYAAATGNLIAPYTAGRYGPLSIINELPDPS